MESGIKDHLTRVIGHYEDCLAEFGDDSRGVDWRSKESQWLRFQILTSLADLNGLSVLDVGCGIGHLHDYLAERRLTVDYEGCDISPKMIDEARRRLPNQRFQCCDILCATTVPLLRQRYDVVTASGVFLVKMDVVEPTWRAFVEQMIASMFQRCDLGISFNLLSSEVDFRDERLYYCAPEQALRFALSLSRYVVIRHDYPLYEYVVYIYRNPPLGKVKSGR